MDAKSADGVLDGVRADGIYLLEVYLVLCGTSVCVHHSYIYASAIFPVFVFSLEEGGYQLAGLEMGNEVFLGDGVGIGVQVVGAIIIYHVIDKRSLCEVHRPWHYSIILAVVDSLDASDVVFHQEVPAIEPSPNAVGEDVLAEHPPEVFFLFDVIWHDGGGCFSIFPVGIAAVYDVCMAFFSLYC